MSSTGLYVLASATSPIPLSYLDYNFNYVNESVSLVSSTVAAISTTVNALSATVGSIYNSLSNVSITVFLQGQPSSNSSNVWSIIGSNTFVPSQTVSVSNEASFSSALSTTQLTLLSFTSAVSTTGTYFIPSNIGLAFSGSGALLSNGYIAFENNYIQASPTAAIFQPYGYGGTMNYAYPEWFGAANNSQAALITAVSLAPIVVCNGSYTNVLLFVPQTTYLIGSGTFVSSSINSTWYSNQIFPGYNAEVNIINMQGLTLNGGSYSLVGNIQYCKFNNTQNMFTGIISNCSFSSYSSLGVTASTTVLYNTISFGTSSITIAPMIVGTSSSSVSINPLTPGVVSFIGNEFKNISSTYVISTSTTDFYNLNIIGNSFISNTISKSTTLYLAKNGSTTLMNNTFYPISSSVYSAYGQTVNSLAIMYAANNSGTVAAWLTLLPVNQSSTILSSTLAY